MSRKTNGVNYNKSHKANERRKRALKRLVPWSQLNFHTEEGKAKMEKEIATLKSRIY